jgi:polyisoprenoid-binding protein YceI
MQTQTQPTTQTAARYELDASHSSVGFRVRHMMITNVRGEFGALTGEVTFDRQRPEASLLTASIDVSSIDTHEEKRDQHLKSADFFDVENHPKMTYVSKSVRAAKGGYLVEGELTIRGTTRPVTLTVTDVTAETTDPWGQRRIGASATAKVRRSEFGMTWNAALEAGGVLVGDEVNIEIEVSLIRRS